MNPNTETHTITARYVNAPKTAGGKFWNIKDAQDNVWFCEEWVGKSVQKGQTITIEAHTEKWSKGPVKIINRVLDEMPRTNGTQAPQPTADKPAQPVYRGKTREESCEIFVCGVLQNCFQGTASLPGAREIASMILNLRRAWYWATEQDPHKLPEKAEQQTPNDPNRPPF